MVPANPAPVAAAPAKSVAEKGNQVEHKWILKTLGIETQGLIKIVKHHLIDIICRLSPHLRDKMKALMFSEEMSADDCQPALLCYVLKGVQLGNQDVSVEDYLKEILGTVSKRVKCIPPIRRKEVDLKMVLNTL